MRVADPVLGSGATMSTGDRPAVPEQTFRFRFDPRYKVAGLPFGVTDRRAWVRLGPRHLEAHLGPWTVRTPIANLAGAEITGPYGFARTAGPAHLSFTDRGITFATNGDRGACVRFHEPVRGLDPGGVLRHPGLTVTVADVEGFRAAVAAVL